MSGTDVHDTSRDASVGRVDMRRREFLKLTAGLAVLNG